MVTKLAIFVALLLFLTNTTIPATVVCTSPPLPPSKKPKDDWFYVELPPGVPGTRLLTGSGQEYKVYQNLWFHTKKYHGIEDSALVASGRSTLDTGLTQNLPLTLLPVNDPTAYYANLQSGWVQGTTLLLDFPFPAFPENLGHWVEVLLPAYSSLSAANWGRHAANGTGHLDSLFLPNLRKAQLEGLDWVWEMLKLALQPGLPQGLPLPRIIYQDDIDAFDPMHWLGFENVLIISDRYTHPDGRAGFDTPELGRKFRDAAFERHSINRTWLSGGTPRTITFLTNVHGENVANPEAVLVALQDVGRSFGLAVRPYSVTTKAPFQSFLAAMARTGVLVSRHGPLLANSLFLPPGAMVLELLPYNWDWKGISEIYINVTRSVGDIHHFAWRARHPRWVAYQSPDDERFADWTPEECSSQHCLEVHARCAMIVDTATVQEMIMDVLLPVLNGEAVETLRKPWPGAELPEGTGTGLWWDKR